MNKSGRKKKRDDRGSWEDEGLNEAKRLNIADNNEPSLAELKEMLTDIQTKVTNIQLENLNLKEDLIQLRAAFQSQKRDLEKLKTTLETTTKTNVALQQELQSAKKSLKEEIEEKERLSEGLDDLEQYTRKNALEIHGVPENLYSTTEEVVIKLGETLNVSISPEDIEISHKLNAPNKPIIVKFLSHKVKSKLYKKRVELKNFNVSDLFPTSGYATAIGRGNRIFLNENLTAYRRSIVKKANKMRKDNLLVSVWTIDGKVFVKTSPSGEAVRVYSLEDLDSL